MTRAPSGAHTFLVLYRAARAMEECALGSIGTTGLCATDFGVLEALLHKGSLPVNSLGRKLLLTSGSMTTSIDRLVARDLVERRDDPGDRRVRVVALTAAGRRLITSAFARHATHLDDTVAILSREERTTLVTLLKKLGKHAAGVAITAPRSPRRSRRHPA